MGQLNLNLTSFDVFWTNALQGFGFGLAFTPMTVLAFATLPAGQITEASGVFTLVRNFGSSLFISLSIALLVRSTDANYARMVEFINLFNRTLKGPGMPAAWDIVISPPHVGPFSVKNGREVGAQIVQDRIPGW